MRCNSCTKQGANPTTCFRCHPLVSDLPLTPLPTLPLLASGESGSGRQYSLKCVREHSLARTSCNMVVGPMGGQDPSKETVAVQSMDGQLALFSAAGHAFTSFIPDFLVPGPLCHLRWIDAIATVNSFGRLDAFK